MAHLNNKDEYREWNKDDNVLSVAQLYLLNLGKRSYEFQKS